MGGAKFASKASGVFFNPTAIDDGMSSVWLLLAVSHITVFKSSKLDHWYSNSVKKNHDSNRAMQLFDVLRANGRQNDGEGCIYRNAIWK